MSSKYGVLVQMTVPFTVEDLARTTPVMLSQKVREIIAQSGAPSLQFLLHPNAQDMVREIARLYWNVRK